MWVCLGPSLVEELLSELAVFRQPRLGAAGYHWLKGVLELIDHCAPLCFNELYTCTCTYSRCVAADVLSIISTSCRSLVEACAIEPLVEPPLL
jgi:hypothetical protein